MKKDGSVILDEKLLELISKEDTLKILTTVDQKGVPHSVPKHTLRVEDGVFIYLELIETSTTNKNMVASIWFDKFISILVIGSNGKSYQVKAKPHKALVSGKKFQKYYEQIREELGDVDLSTVWIMVPTQVTEQTLMTRIKQENEIRPYFQHLDRIANQQILA